MRNIKLSTIEIFVGLFLIASGLFSDLIRSRSFGIGGFQAALMLCGVVFILLGSISNKLLLAISEPLIFFGFLVLLVGINVPILTGSTINYSDIFYFPIFLVGFILILTGLYYKNKKQPEQMPSQLLDRTLHKSIKYRPEIDGLRALAVIPVLLYHLKFKGFEGGFIGVDVFFVISGYLITNILYREALSNNFSIIRFYERRIRRIFPALFLVLCFVILAGWLLIDPETYKYLGLSIFSTTLFSSNFQLWHQSGYFDKSAELKPLLHTWSLAVEEQFYFFYPLFFVSALRVFKNHLKWVLTILAIFFLALSQYWLNIDSSADFYLIQFRVWELLLGGLLSLRLIPQIKSEFIAQTFGVMGFGLIIYTVVFYSQVTPFPGLAALPPTIGAFLILYATENQSTITGNLLSSKPIAFIGKISYSLYLWHWVLIVFFRYYNIIELTTLQNIVLIIVLLVISIISWRYVEIPFRNKDVFSSRAIFSLGLVFFLIVSFSSLYIFKQNGFVNRFETTLPKFSKSYKNQNKELYRCLYAQNLYSFNLEEPFHKKNVDHFCEVGTKGAPITFTVIGDSHTLALSYGIDEIFQKFNVRGSMFYKNGCIPYLEISRETNPNCTISNEYYIKYLSDNPNIKTVFLVGRWTEYIIGKGYKSITGPSFTFKYLDDQMDNDGAKNKDVVAYGVDIFISKLETMGKQVVFVNDVPEVGYNVPESTFIAMRTSRDINEIIAPTKKDFNLRYDPIFEIVADLQNTHPKLLTINLYDALCDDTDCVVEVDGKPLYYDDDHLNYYGAVYVANNVEYEFLNALKSP